MPRGVLKSKEVVEATPVVVEAPVVEAPVVETPEVVEEVVVEAPVVETEVEELVPSPVVTGKFTKLSHNGKFFLVGKDGRILSAGKESENRIDDMVKRLNDK